ncbi:MAG: hypothetical protein IT581_09125 [Verrucomicrobiales bacterium]|nr:hypothetical protein [Verrucomicrobiales bacterium]
MKPLLVLVMALSGHLVAMATPFTYQGQLQQDGQPANGEFELRVGLFANSDGGTPLGGPQDISKVRVSQGAFTIDLDFGDGVFDGGPRWLDFSVGATGSGTLAPLTPRQPLRAVPYAQFALTPAGPPGPRGEKGEPGILPSTGSAGINLGNLQPQAALHVAPLEGSKDALVVGQDKASGGKTALVVGLTEPEGGASYLQSIAQSGIAYGNLLLNQDGGNVGIGVTNPVEKLQVAGAVVIGDTATASPLAGTLRFTGSEFQGYSGTSWQSLAAAPTGQTGPTGPTGQTGQGPANIVIIRESMNGDGESLPTIRTTLSKVIYQVPTGKMLVLKDISAYASAGAAQTRPSGYVLPAIARMFILTSHGPRFLPVAGGASNSLSSSDQILFYAFEGERIEFIVDRWANSGGIGFLFEVTVVGELSNMP